jgi:hypothetical protein
MNYRSAFVLILAFVYGCASTPKMPHIASGEHVSIKVGLAEKATGATDMTNDALGKDTGKGAASGAMVGGLYGLSCGPLLILCVPLGAAMGGIAGTLGGAAVSVDGALTREQADQLRDRMLRFNEGDDQLAALRGNITERAARYWQLDSGQPGHLVQVQVQDLILGSDHGDQIRPILRVLVTVSKIGEKKPARPISKLYEYEGPYAGLPVWMDEDNDFVATSLNSARQQIATQIITDLAF